MIESAQDDGLILLPMSLHNDFFFFAEYDPMAMNLDMVGLDEVAN
jgi:hypothetical protein